MAPAYLKELRALHEDRKRWSLNPIEIPIIPHKKYISKSLEIGVVPLPNVVIILRASLP